MLMTRDTHLCFPVWRPELFRHTIRVAFKNGIKTMSMAFIFQSIVKFRMLKVFIRPLN